MMTLKVMALIRTPVIRTKRRLGSQFLSRVRNPYIFVRWDMPAIIRPHPKTIPMMNRISFAMNYFDF
jgi:hypothetical protein